MKNRDFNGLKTYGKKNQLKNLNALVIFLSILKYEKSSFSYFLLNAKYEYGLDDNETVSFDDKDAFNKKEVLCQFLHVAATLVAECISRRLKSPLH